MLHLFIFDHPADEGHNLCLCITAMATLWWWRALAPGGGVWRGWAGGDASSVGQGAVRHRVCAAWWDERAARAVRLYADVEREFGQAVEEVEDAFESVGGDISGVATEVGDTVSSAIDAIGDLFGRRLLARRV